jgi:asparagine synthase (glutamine-hydrolysing)
VRAAIKAGFARTWLERKKTSQTDVRRLARTLPERLYYDLTVFNLPQLLRYEDRNSMAFSIESRVPFLDYRLVEFISSLPSSMKIRHDWTKWVLRQAMAEVLPE